MAAFLKLLGSAVAWVSANPAAVAKIGNFVLAAIQALTGNAAVKEAGTAVVDHFPAAGTTANPV